jgi:hypothetical protein
MMQLVAQEIFMSKMADLSLEIQDMLERGSDPVTIAKILEIPITWVYETSENMNVESSTEVFSPFHTINS